MNYKTVIDACSAGLGATGGFLVGFILIAGLTGERNMGLTAVLFSAPLAGYCALELIKITHRILRKNGIEI